MRKPIACAGQGSSAAAPDRAGRIRRRNDGLGDDRRSAIAGGGKELPPELLRSGVQDALQLVQLPNPRERFGEARGRGFPVGREVGVHRPPKRRFGAGLSARAPRNDPGDIAPMSGGLPGARLALASARLRIGADLERGDQGIGVGLGRIGAVDADGRPVRRAAFRPEGPRDERRGEPANMRMRSFSTNGHRKPHSTPLDSQAPPQVATARCTT